MAFKSLFSIKTCHFIILILILLFNEDSSSKIDDTLVFTVASTETDGFQRYLRSALEYGIKPIVLGYGQPWRGGDDIKNKPGGGWKINLLKEALQPYKHDKNRLVLFTDGYDVIFLNDLKSIVTQFEKMDANVLFGSEAVCRPDASLESQYPVVTQGKRFLNSGLYIGYVPQILELLEHKPIQDTNDDQLYFTKIYLDETLRKKMKFKLDHKSEIFQNLNKATDETELFNYENKEYGELRLRNIRTNTQPMIVHGNKTNVNALGNYLARAWMPEVGCNHCKWGQLNLQSKASSAMPLVFLALFIEQATPFIEEQLQKVSNLEYPKERIHLFIYNNVKYHVPHIQEFVKKHGTEYLSTKEIKPDDATTLWMARDLSLDLCLTKKCDLYFAVDSIVHLDNPHTLRLLAEQNRSVVAPLLVRPEKVWSNFWGALTADGFYARSDDYMDIVHNDKRGLWNVPYITSCYLINATLLQKYSLKQLSHVRDNMDADMAFCANLRDLEVFMYVSNRLDFGHLVNPDTYNVTLAAPDMYEIFENEKDWQDRYIHPDYYENFIPDKKPVQPCQDVFSFPLVTKRFAKDLIRIMESTGQWSDGSNDKRLEAVPKRDIHMKQVGWDSHLLHFLQHWVRPLQEHIFIGYYHNPSRSVMNFVVRSKPDDLPSLQPHHDISTYTINIALNKKGKDYEGGGWRFLRYNCSVVDVNQGWILMHPGRLTHVNEELVVTKGVRYVMVAFVDP